MRHEKNSAEPWREENFGLQILDENNKARSHYGWREWGIMNLDYFFC